MTTPTPDNLESQLRELTTYRGDSHDLWQRALDESQERKPSLSWIDRLGKVSIPRRVMFAGVACIGLIGVTAALLPSLQDERSAAVTLGSHVRVENPALWKSLGQSQNSLGLATENLRDGLIAASPAPSAGVVVEGNLGVTWAPNFADGRQAGRDVDGQQFIAGQAKSFVAQAQPNRSVIQKATIDLQTPDVRAAFAKASYLISSAGGEFVENSAITGEGKTAQANLTLRVGAVRLSEVLNQLRELGKVQSEKTTGEDVTSQVVDLEARLRNEQRIEKELLELLDMRADAPLKDILELRSSLSAVRQTIEQYIAQRDRLNHLVSLASILVVIRAEPEAAPKPEPAQSLTNYFLHGISETWHDGLRSLADSISWLLSILIRGTLFWLLLAAILLAIHRYRRRLAARCV